MRNACGSAGCVTGLVGCRGISRGWDESNGSGSRGMSRDSRVGSGRLAGGARYCGDCGTSWYVACCRVMSRDVGKGLDPKRDERETSCTAGDESCRGRRDMPREMRHTTGDESCRGRRDMPREMRHTTGGGCRRQVWRRKTSRGAEDASGGGRHIGRRKMHWKAEDASEGGGGVGSRSRV